MTLLAVDIETRDPNLSVLGPGGVRKDGYVICISIHDGTETKVYDLEQDNLDEFPIELYQNSDIIGANVLYDVEWIHAHYGVKPNGRIIDVQLAERILKPNSKSVKLERLSRKYLGVSKQFDEIEEWWKKNKKKKDGKAIENLHLVPAHLVRKYCKADAEYAYKIWSIQEAALESAETRHIFDRESSVLPVLFEMRLHGVPYSAHTQLATELGEQIKERNAKLLTAFGIEAEDFNIQKLDQKKAVARYCDEHRIAYKKTEKSAVPQFDKKFYKRNPDSIFTDIQKLNEHKKLKHDFIDKLAAMATDGIMYCVFHPYKSDSNGTVTGRFASTNPNLQQIPIRSEVGKIIRSQFYAPEGYVWVKADYSQQEVRYLVHLGVDYNIEKALEISSDYYADPDLDFYNVVTEICHSAGNKDITRSHSKTLLLGINYGMGVDKLAEDLGVTVAKAKDLKYKFLDAVPLIKEVQSRSSSRVKTDRKITTIAGREIPFDRFQRRLTYDQRMAIKEKNPEDPILTDTFTYSELLEKHEGSQKFIIDNYEVAYAYRGLNYIIQGSCADITKQAMINCYKEGLVPCLTVHDELDFILKDDETLPSKIETIRRCMEDTYKLHVPMKVDIEVGKSWGELEAYKNEICV